VIFLSSGDPVVLKDSDGLAEASGRAGPASEFAEDAPAIELDVGAFAGAAQAGV
jgi:hypothetical protein